MDIVQTILAVLRGSLVGFTLGLIGGGGSIMATPLLLYVVGLPPHVAIGTGALAVSANSFINFGGHARSGNVRWRRAILFAVIGMAGAAIGSTLGKTFDGQRLLFLFAVLMVVVGVMMPRRGSRPQGSAGASAETFTLGAIAKVTVTALIVGMLSGFFGIGGGFLIVPGLLFSTGMPMILAVGSFGLTTAVNYGWSGLVNWQVAAEYIAGGIAGGQIGMRLCNHLAPRKAALNKVFAGLVSVAAAVQPGARGRKSRPLRRWYNLKLIGPAPMYLARTFLGVALGIATAGTTSAAEPLHVYGPGGPYPAIKEAAAAFGKAHGIDVDVTAGPTGKWLDKAKDNADVIFSGSESMMSDFVTAFGGQIEDKAVTPLYLRPSAILVRPGNPGHIGGIADLMKPGHKILVVNGSGQGGLWEDVAGRKGDIGAVKGLRANIGQFAATSADAKQTWTTDTSYDAWLIWNIWQVANPTIADQVAVEPEYRVYRDTGVAVTRRGAAKPEAKEFAAFLASADGAQIFAKWGWTVPGTGK